MVEQIAKIYYYLQMEEQGTVKPFMKPNKNESGAESCLSEGTCLILSLNTIFMQIMIAFFVKQRSIFFCETQQTKRCDSVYFGDWLRALGKYHFT